MVFFSGIVFQFHLWEKRGRKEDAEVILQLNFFFFLVFLLTECSLQNSVSSLIALSYLLYNDIDTQTPFKNLIYG